MQDLYKYQAAILLEKKLSGSLDSVFPYNCEIQRLRYTRQSRLLHIQRCESKFASKLPVYMLPSIWNGQAIYLKIQPVINLESMSNQH